MAKKVKSWEDLINDGEQYGASEVEYNPTEKVIIESIKDKTVLKIQDKYAFSKTGQSIGENHGVELARIIANFEPCRDVTSFILTHNELGPEGLQQLVESEKLTQIEYLHLGSNRLGDEGLRILSQAKIFSKVHTLNLECNGITAEGATALASSPVFTKVTSLNLVDNRIGEEGALAFADSDTFKNLTYLHLGGNRIKSKEVKEAVRNSPKLSQLKTLKIF